MLAVGILHQRVPALVAGGAGDIEWQRVAVGCREWFVVPLGDGQGFACHLAGGDPVDDAVGGERVFLQLARAAVAVNVDDITAGQGRQ
ncbi:hypothetical protein D3C84_502070 [compost metagenome]